MGLISSEAILAVSRIVSSFILTDEMNSMNTVDQNWTSRL